MSYKLEAVRCYLQQASKYPLLSREEEVKLAKIIEKGAAAERRLANGRKKKLSTIKKLKNEVKAGLFAEQTLICSNLRLVVNRALYFSRKYSVELPDLINEGNKVLTEFVRRIGRNKKSGYDWRRGNKVSTYLYRFLFNGLRGYCNDNFRLIRLPPSVVSGKVKNRQLRREAERKILYFSQFKRDKPEEDGEGGQFEIPDYRGENPADIAARNDDLEHHRNLVFNAINELIKRNNSLFDERDREIIFARFGVNGYERPHRLHEIGAMFGVSKERIRQLEIKAIKNIKKQISLDPAPF